MPEETHHSRHHHSSQSPVIQFFYAARWMVMYSHFSISYEQLEF